MAAPEVASSGDTAWILTSCALVLLMTPGLAFFYGGMVQRSNVLNTMMMSIVTMGMVALPWMFLGFSLAFGGGAGGFIGDLRHAGFNALQGRLWPGTALPALLFAVYQMTFCVVGCAIISGSVVERMQFSAYIVFIPIWSVLVYAPVCHWVWGPDGWIDEMGAKDFAGGTVVHESTAVSALVLAVLLGPRSMRSAEQSTQAHNVPIVILGAALLWFGWSGFNAGSALAANEQAVLALVNTYQAAGASLVTWILIERWTAKRYSAVGSVTGAIVGLVLITPGAGLVTPVGAALIGVLGCVVVYPAFSINKNRVDDSLDTFPCHGVAGFVGTVLTGLFATEGGLFYGGGFRLVGAQFVASAATAAYSAAMTAIIFGILSLVMRMRVTAEVEIAGLDSMLHKEKAYHTDTAISPSNSFTSNDHDDDHDDDSEVGGA